MKICSIMTKSTHVRVAMNWKQKLGVDMKRARSKKGLNQEDLASLVGLHPNTIGNYERGRRSPDFDDLQKIASALGEPRFEISDEIRIEFGKNGRPHLAPVAQQLTIKFDENKGVNVRIEPSADGITIKRMSA
jgi:transcriptional regulator with XRE-family HTH domain